MADNYLERQYEKWKEGGRSVTRRDVPSLETLLGRLSDPETQADTSYILKQAQIDAVARAVGKIPGAEMLDVKSSESDGSLTVSCADKALLGAAAMVARLKAAELHLRARVTEGPGYCMIELYKA